MERLQKTHNGDTPKQLGWLGDATRCSRLELIKKPEGLRLSVLADIAGFYTVGYGNKLQCGESFPSGVTESQATALLLADVSWAEHEVNVLVTVPLTQGQFDALVSAAMRWSSSTRCKAASSTIRRWRRIQRSKC